MLVEQYSVAAFEGRRPAATVRPMPSAPSRAPNAGLSSAHVAVVVIGRNEGERLRRCLRSVVDLVDVVVYVDSGSTDGSMAAAEELGVIAVPLDMSVPFTAARARNVGFGAAIRIDPDIALIQFVDGDTEVAPTWIGTAVRFMADNPRAAAVFGRRRERHPEASIYNQLCDVEWSVPPGMAKYCGGDVMMRRDAFEGVRGYTDALIAGEEPDLCVRLRRHQWSIHCIDAEMTLHDAAMVEFGQWWRRTTRSGYAFAQGAHMHGAAPERHWVRETWRIWIWGLVIPLLTGLSVLAFGPQALWLLAIYPLQIVRVFFKYKGPANIRAIRAFFYTLARFPEMVGLARFHALRLLGRRATIIEYK
jgi:glycosyltransferase involved in cell wall biosynthesis